MDALLDLVGEGNPRPTAPAIAERTGVSLRFVFQHFRDLESLFLAAPGQHIRRVLPMYEEPLPEGTTEQRVSACIARRACIWERVTPLRRAARHHSSEAPQLERLLAGGRALHRGDVATVFAPEGPSVDELDAVDLVLSWDAWEAPRGERGLSVERSTQILESAVGAIVGAGRADGSA